MHKEIYRLFIKPPNKSIFPHIRQDYVERMLKKNQVITHSIDNKILGAIIWLQYKRDDTRQIGNKFDLQLKQIVVHPDYQHSGIGVILFHKLEELAKKLQAPNICLSVRETNAQAQRFYEKMGMIVTGNIQWQEKGKLLPGIIYKKENRSSQKYEDLLIND